MNHPKHNLHNENKEIDTNDTINSKLHTGSNRRSIHSWKAVQEGDKTRY